VHFTGTELVVEHVEKNWCPSFTSADITGGQPFRFAEDRRTPGKSTVGEQSAVLR